MTIQEDTVTLIGNKLAVGEQSEPTSCPFCNATHEEKFSVKRVEDGFLYNCFRGKCGARGFVPAAGGYGYAVRNSAPVPERHKPYDNTQLKALDSADYEFFRQTWGIRQNMLAHNVFVSPQGEYVFRIRDSRDATKGWHVRQPVWKGVNAIRTGVAGKPKGMTYKDLPDTSKAAWFNRESNGPVVIVEDYLSAIKVRQAGFASVCLFGTVLSNVDKDEIRQRGLVDGTVMWLDADAQDSAYRNAQRHGVNLNMRVVCTTNDPKTLTEGTIREVIG